MEKEIADKITHTLLGFSSGFIFAFLLWKITASKIGYLTHQGGYHFHHSLFGLLAFLFIPIFRSDSNKTFFIVGFGLGVILQHTIKERFVFITKDSI